MATTIKMESQNMCSGCPALCCKISAEITSYDIARIILNEGKDCSDFVQLARARSDDQGFVAKNECMMFVLKHNQGSCVFLSADQKCSIENSKPSLCLSYPFELRFGKLFIRHDKLCPLKNLLRPDIGKMSKEVLEDYYWERDRYYEIVDDWNLFAEGTESPELFLKYAFDQMELESTPMGSIIRKIKRLF
jgi:Fe-S-cluster containining protein